MTASRSPATDANDKHDSEEGFLEEVTTAERSPQIEFVEDTLYKGSGSEEVVSGRELEVVQPVVEAKDEEEQPL